VLFGAFEPAFDGCEFAASRGLARLIQGDEEVVLR
jgi:hypothetical protein